MGKASRKQREQKSLRSQAAPAEDAQPQFSNQQPAAASLCLHCGKRTKKPLYCLCTRVVFCSTACERDALSSDKHNCPGAPTQRLDLGRQAETILARGRRDGLSMHELGGWAAEHRTVLQQAIKAGARKQEVSEFIQLADKGNAACAYMAGSMLKLGMSGNFSVDATCDATTKGVIHSEKWAYKYVKQAADAGIGIAMQSLADMYENGRGVRRDVRQAEDWLWCAALTGSNGAFERVDSMSVLTREIQAMNPQVGCGGSSQKLFQTLREQQAQSIMLSGPNLGSLLVSLHPSLLSRGGTLPKFASTYPGAAAPCTSTISCIGLTQLQAVASVLHELTEHGYTAVPTYGRRGTAPGSTAMANGDAKRIADRQCFSMPPLSVESDQCSPEAWLELATQSEFKVLCGHSNKDNKLVCSGCLIEAQERIAAVAKQAVVLSLHETLPNHGQLAIFRDQAGRIKSETFKNYSRGEVEVVLAALVKSGRPEIANPLFVAQDANFFWPVIWYHGSVHAAFKFVAPQLDWHARLKPFSDGQLQAEPLLSVPPGTLLQRCGADSCTSLEPAGAKTFQKCGKCKNRWYCSRACQTMDHEVHKHECTRGVDGSLQMHHAHMFDVPAETPEVEAETNMYWKSTGLSTVATNTTSAEIEWLADTNQVQLCGLSKRPELNGCLGVVLGGISVRGRYPVKVSCGDADVDVTVRAHNLCLVPGTDVQLEAHKGGHRYLCSVHDRKVCDDCCLDLGLVNQLCLARGGMTQEALERVIAAHFSLFKHDLAIEAEPFDSSEPYSSECHGVRQPMRQAMLRNTLVMLKDAKSSMRLGQAASGLGIVTHGARHVLWSRPCVLPLASHFACLCANLNDDSNNSL